MKITTRVFKKKTKNIVDYSIGEAWCDDNGRVFAWTTHEPISTSGINISDEDALGALKLDISDIMVALSLPVLDENDLPHKDADNFLNKLES